MDLAVGLIEAWKPGGVGAAAIIAGMGDAASGTMQYWRDWRWVFERLGPLAALVALIVGTAAVEAVRVDSEYRVFLTTQNLLNLATQWSYVGIVAIGMTFVIILGGIDLSVGSIVALSAGAALYVMNAAAGDGVLDPSTSAFWPILAAVGVCVLGGGVLGLINGVLIGKGRVAPFVATLGTMAAYRAIILARADGGEIRSRVPQLGTLGRSGIDLPYIFGGTRPAMLADGTMTDGFPIVMRWPVVVFAAMAVLAHVVLRHTTFGLHVYAIGDNAKAARYAGIRIPRVTMMVYALAGLMCGVAAFLAAARFNSVASSQMGMFYELDAIAAVVIGGTRLKGGSGRIYGTVIGVLVLAVVGNMLNLLDVQSHYHGLVKGAIIIAAVLLQPSKASE